jgi:hypothetical protein
MKVWISEGDRQWGAEVPGSDSMFMLDRMVERVTELWKATQSAVPTDPLVLTNPAAEARRQERIRGGRP